MRSKTKIAERDAALKAFFKSQIEMKENGLQKYTFAVCVRRTANKFYLSDRRVIDILSEKTNTSNQLEMQL